MSTTSENTRTDADSITVSSVEERPPPVPSKDQSPWRTASLRSPSIASQQHPAFPISPPRLKKKVPWKGKNVMVLLPMDDQRGKHGNAPAPLSEKEVTAMMKDWEQLGYNTTGFNLGGDSEEETPHGQNTSTWPTSADIDFERAQRAFKVSIPDRSKWDAYVKELAEARLRALGVSLGFEEPAPTISPATSNVSRRVSTQYPPLPFSPPIPTSSAASSHANQGNPFSPPILPGAELSTSQSSNPGSIPSPASMHSQLHNKYNNKQSISFSSDHPFGSPFQFPQQQSPGFWSPQQQMAQQGHARGGSPSMHNLGSVMSPNSPFQDGFFSQTDRTSSPMQQRQQLQLLHSQLQMHGSARASPRLQEVKEADDELTEKAVSKSPSKTPEPPQSVRHNASASLRKEIDDAEYHLEEQFQRQLEHDDYSPHSDHEEEKRVPLHVRNVSNGLPGLSASRSADDDSDGPVLHHPQPHSRGHSLSQRPFQDSEESASDSRPESLRIGQHLETTKGNQSDIKTNPSGLGTSLPETSSGHDRSLSVSSNPWLDSEPNNTEDKRAPRPRLTHGPKPSMSKLNVTAKEFKFDPTSAFMPSQFLFSGGNFQPTTTNYAPSTNGPTSGSSSQFSNPSVGSSRGKINVAAPAFMPGHSDFSFSSSGPTFRPDAPAFTPSTFGDSVGSGGSGSEGPRSSIFGKLDFNEIGKSKPARKSKAIPIVRPDSSHTRKVDETVEGKDGRITQGEGRIKRACGRQDDGDSVPLFAEPSMPLGQTNREQSQPRDVQHNDKLIDKDNAAPVKDDEGSPEAEKSFSSASSFEQADETRDKDFAPFEFSKQKQAEDFYAARPFTSRRYASGLPGYGYQAPNEEPPATLEEEPISPPAKDDFKKHKKTGSNLSATAKPFEFRPGAFSFTFNELTEPKEPKAAPTPPIPPIPKGLSASRFAATPSPPASQPPAHSPEASLQPEEIETFQASLPQPESPPKYEDDLPRSPTFEEIDAVMRQLNENELESSAKREADTPKWHQPSPTRQMRTLNADNSSPIRLLPQNVMRSDAPSPSPRKFQTLPPHLVPGRIFSRGQDDPFVEKSKTPNMFTSPIHRLNTAESPPASDWDDMISESEDFKFQSRARFFDGHVDIIVGRQLSQRLDPLEKTLETIQMSLDMMAVSGLPTRRDRDRRSISGASSDADDEEDDERVPRRSLSPKRDKKLEKIRAVVTEALAAHQSSRPQSAATSMGPSVLPDSRNVLKALEEMKEQFGQSMRLDLRGEDLRNIVEEAVERRMPASPKPEEDGVAPAKNSVYRARIAELEERLRLAEEKAEEEIIKRRNAEESRAKMTMRIALLDAAQDNAQKSHSELSHRIHIADTELQEARKEISRLQLDAERAMEAASRHSEDAEVANDTNKGLRRTIEALSSQLEESTRVREGMRGKLMDLQEEMARAARDITDENSRRAKKEVELVARQEVLDAKLQAEARTRERLEQEIDRLEHGGRDSMRAVSECKRLEALLADLRTESHTAQKEAMRYQREFEEARESGLGEVQRMRKYMQAEIDNANNQVNVVREDLEYQVTKVRAEMDQVKLDADTAKAQHEMLLEEANTSKNALVKELTVKHANEIEDLQAQHDRQLGNAIEDAQRSEQHLLERLSLSSAKTEHLQDRVQHLEEKLEVTKSAANAAAQAARSAGLSKPVQPAQRAQPAPAPVQEKAISRAMQLPEKISPQALRESIMVLQEQLQDREQKIEQLEQTLSKADLDAPSKLSKRDDEIKWLRELLVVRKSDLQDIVNTISSDTYDPDAIKDAAIRLHTNLKMEEQERERAMNSGSAINIPNIATSLRDAATPRVAQAVGPLAAAWGNWRKGRESDIGNNRSTPARSNSPSAQSFLSGLLTPPASSVRTPPGSQATAFGSTGQRFTSAQLANRRRTMTPRRQEKMPMRGSPRRGGPSQQQGPPATPPMMRKNSYDLDARAENFSDAGFYHDDESTVDEYGAAGYGR